MGNITWFLILGVCLLYVDARFTRSTREVVEFENYLRRTVNGIPTPSANEETKKLQNVWENSGKYQGDILLTEEQIQEKTNQYATKNALVNQQRRWPNKIVYYEFSSAVTTTQRNNIITAMNDISSKSCVRFVQRGSSNPNFVTIENKNDGCYAHVGYWPGYKTVVNLAPNCYQHGVIVHEFLHTLGFEHMQCTYNRDDWVRIIWNKIQQGMEYNFDKYTTSQVTNLGETYDYGSVMHYSAYAFSRDGSKTIETIQPGGNVIGQITGLSPKDITRIRKLYEC